MEPQEPVTVTLTEPIPGPVTVGLPETRRDSGKRLFEQVLWNSRLIVIIPVVASLCLAVAMFYAATMDAINNYDDLKKYLTFSPLDFIHDANRTHLITHIVEAIDGYLLGVVLLIFAMGMYELFVSRIGPAHNSDRAKGILIVHSIDDLKTRLSQVILLMLVVKFFEGALGYTFDNHDGSRDEAINLAIIAGAIVFVGLALALTQSSEAHRSGGTDDPPT